MKLTISVVLTKSVPTGWHTRRRKEQWKQLLVPFDGDWSDEKQRKDFVAAVKKEHPGWKVQVFVPV